MKAVSRLSSAGLSGTVIGEWTVGPRLKTNTKKAEFLCRCSCGTERSVSGCRLIRGRTKSCGCKRASRLLKARVCERCGVQLALSRKTRHTKFCSDACRSRHVSSVARFWLHVDKRSAATGCWPWTAAKTNGYGSFSMPDRTRVRAHRFSYELHFGKIPPGLMVMHSCDNPACVNPDHLSVGTNLDNCLDKVCKDRSGFKLRAGQVRAIRQQAAAGVSQAMLAKTHRVSASHVHRIVHRTNRATVL
jgi:hypothetical protein